MNSVQMHLALTHVPVILSLIGLVMLSVAFFVKNPSLTKTSYVLLFIAAIAALPVFFTGEETEEAIENLPGVSESIIKSHEELANLAMVAIALAGAVSFAALFSFRWQKTARALKATILLLAMTAGGMMAQTAHLGGQIRHTEIRTGVAIQNSNDNGGENEGKADGQQEKEDD